MGKLWKELLLLFSILESRFDARYRAIRGVARTIAFRGSLSCT